MQREGGGDNIKVETQGCGLGENVADLRFDLGVKRSTVEVELVLKQNTHKLTVPESEWTQKLSGEPACHHLPVITTPCMITPTS